MLQPNSSPQPDGAFSSQFSLVPVQKDVSAEYYLKLGKKLYNSYLAHSRQQDLDHAIQYFQKAVEMEPNLAQAYVQLASALWDRGTINLELAQFYCETALRLDPSQSEAHLYLGYFLQRAGFREEAKHQYQLAIQKGFWSSARAHIALSSLILKQSVRCENKGQQSLYALRGVVTFFMGCLLLPLDGQTCQLLKESLSSDLKSYLLLGTFKSLKRAKAHGWSLRVLEMATRMMPKEPVFHQLLGDEYLFERNEPGKAILSYQQAQCLMPEDMNLLKKLGKAYAEANHPQKAIDTLSQVAEVHSEDFDTLYQLGQIHTEAGAYFKALYYFKEAKRQKSDYPYLYSSMGYVLFKMDDMEGAFEEYKLALEYGTDAIWLATVAQTLGTLAFQVYHNINEAIDFLQLALSYNPDNQDTLALLADLYFESGQMDLAIGAYRTILQIDPKNADCYNNIGYILWQLDENQSAIDAYMASIYYDKENPVAHNNLGVIYLDEETSPEKALPLFQEAFHLKPDYTLACFNIARAKDALGQRLEAAEYYSKALELNQMNPELEDTEILDYLNRLFH